MNRITIHMDRHDIPDASVQRVMYRFLRDVSDPFRMEESIFKKYFRLSRIAALELIGWLHSEVEPKRTSGIPAHLLILATVRFLAEGSLQKGVGADFNHSMSQSSVSRCISKVIDAIIMKMKDVFIHFPVSRIEREALSVDFLKTIRISNILGLIDCFVVPIARPRSEHAFYNHKLACTGLNVQVIADSKLRIMSMCVSPGSNTDQFIWNSSQIKHDLEILRNNPNVERRYYLLGDNGYGTSPIGNLHNIEFTEYFNFPWKSMLK